MDPAQDSDFEPADPLKAPAPAGAMRIIFFIVFADFLGFGIIIPLLPFYVPGYQDHPLKVSLLFTIFSACQFIGAPILGTLSDRFGRRPVLIVSQIGSAAGYLLLAIATGLKIHGTINSETALWLVYLSRVIDGFTGGNVSTAQAYISDITSGKDRAKAMGLIGAAFGIGFSAGPFIGGTLGHINEVIPAYIAAACATAAALLTMFKLRESTTHKPLDVESWLHPRVFLPVLRRPVVTQLMAISFLSMAAFVMMETIISIFLARHFGYTQRGVGWVYAWIGVVIIIVQGGLIGRLTRRFGEWPLAIAGPTLVTVGMLGFASLAWAPFVWLLLFFAALNATGRSLQGPTLSSLLSKLSPEREQGVVFGLYHGLMSLARVVGPLVAGLTYSYWRNSGPFITGAAIVAIAALWTHLLPSRAQTAASSAESAPEAPGFEVV